MSGNFRSAKADGHTWSLGALIGVTGSNSPVYRTFRLAGAAGHTTAYLPLYCPSSGSEARPPVREPIWLGLLELLVELGRALVVAACGLAGPALAALGLRSLAGVLLGLLAVFVGELLVAPSLARVLL